MITGIRQAVRCVALCLRHWFLVRLYGMDIARSARISWGTRLDRTYPRGIHIDQDSYCASGCLILSHDYARGVRKDTYIGKRCFIGANAIVLPGVRIGDSVIVGAGAIVTKDVPANCVVAGNPGRVIRQGIVTSRFGRLVVEPGTLPQASSSEVRPKVIAAPKSRSVAVQKHESGQGLR